MVPRGFSWSHAFDCQTEGLIREGRTAAASQGGGRAQGGIGPGPCTKASDRKPVRSLIDQRGHGCFPQKQSVFAHFADQTVPTVIAAYMHGSDRLVVWLQYSLGSAGGKIGVSTANAYQFKAARAVAMKMGSLINQSLV